MRMLAALAGPTAVAVALAVTAGGPDDARRAAAAPASVPGLALTLLTDDLEVPLDLVVAPGEPRRLYIVEQAGRIRVFERGRLHPQPFADLARLVKSGGEQGLLSLAFHPRYAQNRRLYVHLTDVWGDTRVLELRSDGRRVLPRTAREVFFADQPYLNHNGGKIAFGPDGRLYLALGDGGSAFDPEDRAQSPRSLMGKLVRIDVDRPGAPREILGYGLRNPWRIAFDPTKGDLYVADVGQDRYEEVNVVPRGERRLLDFGWDVYEGRRRVDGKQRRLGGRPTWPIATYRHGARCSITGGVVYGGRALPELRGRYVFGDFCSGEILSLRWDGRRASVPIRSEGVRLPDVVAFGVDARGEVLLAGHGGAVYRLARAR